MESKFYSTYRLVKSEDLNHHGTLFAGRTAEWFVESGFIAVSQYLDPKNIVCLKIHGMEFKYPVKGGETICFKSKIAYLGKSSIITYIKVINGKTNNQLVDGFISFVHVDETTKPMPHGLKLDLVTEEDTLLFAKAALLKTK